MFMKDEHIIIMYDRVWLQVKNLKGKISLKTALSHYDINEVSQVNLRLTTQAINQ